MGNPFITTALLAPCIVEFRCRVAKINFIFKFYTYLPKEHKERKLCQEARDTSLGLLSSGLFFMEFRLDASRCVVTWVTKSLMPAVLNVQAGRICPAGRSFPLLL